VVDLGLRPEFPGPTLVDLHPSPDQQLLVADIAFGESIGSVIIDPDNGTIRQIPGEFAYFYAWHPDSRRILVSAVEGWLLVDVVSQSYETMDFQSESGDWLPVRALAYSPDGKQLADAIVYPPTVSKPGWEVEVGMRVGERGMRIPLLRVLGGSIIAEHSLRWSPDGRTLIFVADVHNGGRRTQLWAINVSDGTSRLLATLAREVQYNHPAVWSPDGRYIAAIVKESSNENGVVSDNIYLFTLESGDARKITHFLHRRLSHLAWSPDGSRLAFSVSLGDYGEIWVTTLDGTHQHPIAGPATPNAPFVWLP
jgi:WD40 repeat protein